MKKIAGKIAGNICNRLTHFFYPQQIFNDRLLLFLTFASQTSQYRTTEISLHLTTNAWAIEQFGLAKIDINQTTGVVNISPNPQV